MLLLKKTRRFKPTCTRAYWANKSLELCDRGVSQLHPPARDALARGDAVLEICATRYPRKDAKRVVIDGEYVLTVNGRKASYPLYLTWFQRRAMGAHNSLWSHTRWLSFKLIPCDCV